MTKAFPCVIFAGGRSSRMGRDKSLLPFGGYSTLAQYQFERLGTIFNEVFLVTKDPKKFTFDAPLIVDRYDIYAPLSGFLSVFETLRVERFFAVGIDMPFIPIEVVLELDRSDEARVDATLAKTQNGIETLCGIYHVSLYDAMRRGMRQNEFALRKLLQNSVLNTVYFENTSLFFNMNRPEEYEKAKELYDIIGEKREHNGKPHPS